MSSYFNNNNNNNNKHALMVCSTVYHTFDLAFPTYRMILICRCCENTIMNTDRNIKVRNVVDSTAAKKIHAYIQKENMQHILANQHTVSSCILYLHLYQKF
jgi:hypothetical protein